MEDLTGEIEVDGSIFHYEIRFFAKNEAERFGGKIYDLTIFRENELVGFYDRGWVLECENEKVQEAIDELLCKFD